MMNQANRYDLKYVFLYDQYYHPLLEFTGWRKIDTFASCIITAWSKESVPPAHQIPSNAVPTHLESVIWGTLPMASSILAIFFVLALPERRRFAETLEFPASSPVYREAK